MVLSYVKQARIKSLASFDTLKRGSDGNSGLKALQQQQTTNDDDVYQIKWMIAFSNILKT